MLKRALQFNSIILCLILLAQAGCASTQQVGHSGAETSWPVAIDAPGGRIQVYQPQPDSLQGDKLAARAALSVQQEGTNDLTFGAIWMNARISTDRDDRTVTIEDVDVTNVRFPDSTPQQQQNFERILEDQLPQMDITFSLDELMTSLAMAQCEKIDSGEIVTSPPHIIFSPEPATLITINGTPALQQMEQTNVRRVINTPFILLNDPDTNSYYLKTGDTWAGAADIGGPWENGVTPPASIVAAAQTLTPPPRTQQTGQSTIGQAAPASPSAAPGAIAAPSAVDQELPPTGATAATSPPPSPGRIIIATEPTELIVTSGEPQFAPIVPGDLLYITNTRSNVFLDVHTQQNYVLLSGRWFRSLSLDGPWEYVPSDKLPESFAKIPSDSAKADVLAFVAGTNEAREAVLDASIPQTSAIRRDAGADLVVDYDGEPNFQPIERTTMSYAVNAQDPVVLLNGMYYCCHDAVWYQAPSPRGPWSVCLSVPETIYTIPPNSPIYNATYVRAYDYNATSVYYGYLPGYTGTYVYGPTIVYGTGYNYPGWYGTTYIPAPTTYGYGPYFDLYAGTWDFGFSYSWGPLWIARDRYRHHRFFGPGGFRPHWREWNGWNGARFDHRNDFRGNRLNIYRRPSNLARNYDFRTTARRYEVQPGFRNNNVYAGRDGGVYRSTDRGWELRDNRNWTRMSTTPESRFPDRGAQAQIRTPVQGGPVQARWPGQQGGVVQRAPQSSSRIGGLEADRFARQRGDLRAGGFRGSAAAPARGTASPFRGSTAAPRQSAPSGGGFRGGGGGAGGGSRGGGGGGRR